MAVPDEKSQYDTLEARLQIYFTRRDLLVQALTHSSYVADMTGIESNERLEFLGDAILDVIIAEELFHTHPHWSEGDLSKAKAVVVEARSLERLARRWEIGACMRMSHGEESSGGRNRRALLADAVEAVIGAYYLDQGLPACQDFVIREMAELLETIDLSEREWDYKTQLQEAFQAKFQATPRYAVSSVSGPPHARLFQVTVSFAGQVIGRGAGQSKKEAEQLAAEEGLRSEILHQASEGDHLS
jgi:ribonuclease-3